MVKQGYKQTEVGIIPEDWKVSTMESITSLMTNGFVGTIKSEYVPSGTGILYLQGFNIKENGFDLTGVTYVSDSFHKKHLKSELKENDLLTVQTGDIGVTSYLPKQFEGANCQALIISRFYDKYDSRFWSYYFNSTGRKTLKLIETGTTMKHINVGDMKGVLVPVPTTKEEQKCIAEALSDADSMISSLEKLIAKKKAVKQGAMQELLTGRKRLPGFDGEWKTYKLDEIAKIIMGQSPNSKFYNVSEGMPLIQGNADISNRKTQVRFYTTQITKTAFAGDIIFTVRAPVGNVAKTSFDCCIGRGVCALRGSTDFLFHYLIYIEPYWATLSAGSTFDSINSNTLANTELLIPLDVEEQNAIASILSDMDNEIEALEQKLEKTRQIKQGMMQQLLSGKIRLV